MNSGLFSKRWSFFLLILSALIISQLPFVAIPFRWIMTFFHEISHGIAALLTGGAVLKIALFPGGSGLCYTQGGSQFIVAISGYLGAVLWGILLYRMADEISHNHTNKITLCLSALIVIIALLWGRDILTWGILALLFLLFISIVKLQEARLMKLALKFCGLFVLLDAVKAPLYLVDGRHFGDGARLADLTMVPEIIWVLIWLAAGISGAYYLWKGSVRL
jgi:hypothetical protein